MDTNLIEIRRRAPSIVKDEKGRERTENGRWSVRAMAEYVARHPEKLHKASDLCRVANERASESNVERRRRELSKIADTMLDIGIPAVIEWGGRKIVAVGRYNSQDQYHQSLMAAEIGRRTLCADGRAERLQNLVAALPRYVPA